MAAIALSATAQQKNDPVIFEIGGKPIYKSEFMKEFLQSVGKDPSAPPTACTYEKRKALEDYVQLYVNFRTKLADAYALQFDTLRPLKKELRGYREELATPYLIDSVTLDKILREAYERNHYTLHASHILINCNRNSSPSDTLEAYNKALEVYGKAVAGEDFSQLAIQYSDDPSAKGRLGAGPQRQGNGGDLGCFTVFQMVYPFETAAYGLQPGQISKPVRTNYGYHIIKLHEKIPYFGKSDIRHIWVGIKNSSVAESMIRNAYEELKGGADFGAVAKNYSDDRGSLDNGGLLPAIDPSQMPPQYIDAISKLSPGEISEPFQTEFGWHIVMLVRKDAMPPFEDMVPFYKQRLARDQRNQAPREAFAEQCKVRYNFIDYTKTCVDPYETPMSKKKKNQPKTYMASLDEAVAAITDSVYRKKWHYKDTMITDMRPLFKVGDKTYNAVDLLKYVEQTQTMIFKMGDHAAYLNDKYKSFVTDMVLDYADERLEDENPEFRALMEEYRNGLMIFSYNDKMVWSQALRDTAGLRVFYEQESAKRSIDNPDDAPYFWNTRAMVSTYTVDPCAGLSLEKAKKIVTKCHKKGMFPKDVAAQLTEASKCKDTTITPVTFEEDFVEDGAQTLLTNNEWRRGVYERPRESGYTIVTVNKVFDPCLKSVKEARGYYINDYQNLLDAQLIEQLRAKYNVVIHQDVIDEITY